MLNLKAYSNCWICEGWTQMKFIFVSGVTIPREIKQDENVFIHLSFEGYTPDYMLPEKKAGVYYSVRMVPPGPLNFFYTINDEYFHTAEKKIEDLEKPITTVLYI